MPDDIIDHDEARTIAALRQPKHSLSGPYLDLTDKLRAAQKALREIGEAGSLEEAKKIAAAALR